MLLFSEQRRRRGSSGNPGGVVPLTANVLDSDGNTHIVSNNALDSDGNGYSLSANVLDSDGNPFTIFA